MIYPTISEYINAIRFAEDNLSKLSDLRIVDDEKNSPIYIVTESTIIFKMVDDNGAYYALKCFLKDIPGKNAIYSSSIIFSDDAVYMQEELFVDSNISEIELFDVVVSPWVTYSSLSTIIVNSLNNKESISTIFTSLNDFFNELSKLGFTCDSINAYNILIDNRGKISLKNVDDCLHSGVHSETVKLEINYLLLALKLISIDKSIITINPELKYLLFEDCLDDNLNNIEHLSFRDEEVNRYIDAIRSIKSNILSNLQSKDSSISFQPAKIKQDKDGSEAIESPQSDPIQLTEYARQCIKEKKYEEAYKTYLLAANDGFGDGFNGLGCCYERGWYVEKNETKAIEYYHKAADKGSFRGMYNLAHLYETGSHKNHDKSEFYYRMAAERGEKKSQYRVGMIYMMDRLGESFNLSIKRDTAKAYDWLIKSANQNYGPAQYRIGQFYETGTNPCIRNLSRAMEWYQKSKDNGCITAIFGIGLLYANGLDEKNPDDKEAYKYFLCAAQKGNTEAMYKTGIYLYYGRGVEKNESEAIQWLQQAKDKGHDESRNFLYDISKKVNYNYSDTDVTQEDLANAVIDSYGVLYSRDRKKLLKYGIEETDRSGDYYFKHKRESFRNYIVPEGVEIVCENAFNDCSSLTKIEFPFSLRKIGEYAFYGCTNLRLAKLKNGISEIGRMSFYGCEQLSNFVIPNSLEKIGDYAFTQVRSIISENPSYIVYDGCLFDSTRTKLLYFFNDGRKVFMVPYRTKVIEYGAFRNSSISAIFFEEGLEAINDFAFENCEDLYHLRFPNSLKHIGAVCFAGCQSLESITIPYNVKVIESQCFEHCHMLSNVTLHDDIKEIKVEAFCATNIKKIKLPRKLETLAPMAFGFTPLSTIYANCDNFKVVDGVIYNKDMTILVQYYGNNNKFIIPSSVKEINDYAFAFRYIEDEIIFPNTVEKVGRCLFEQVPAPNRIIIPFKLKDQMVNSIERYYVENIVTV